jgi:hypothetical protein
MTSPKEIKAEAPPVEKPSFIPSIPPGSEDSTDLSDPEVESAVSTESSNQLVQLLVRALSPGEASLGKGDARYALAKQEVRRRSSHLFLRSYLVCPGEPPKVLVHRVDWLQPTQTL